MSSCRVSVPFLLTFWLCAVADYETAETCRQIIERIGKNEGKKLKITLV